MAEFEIGVWGRRQKVTVSCLGCSPAQRPLVLRSGLSTWQQLPMSGSFSCWNKDPNSWQPRLSGHSHPSLYYLASHSPDCDPLQTQAIVSAIRGSALLSLGQDITLQSPSVKRGGHTVLCPGTWEAFLTALTSFLISQGLEIPGCRTSHSPAHTWASWWLRQISHPPILAMTQ